MMLTYILTPLVLTETTSPQHALSDTMLSIIKNNNLTAFISTFVNNNNITLKGKVTCC